MNDTKYEVFVDANVYYNDKDRFQSYQDFGDEIIPTDSYGGYVPEKKHDPTNLKKTQVAIQKRFALKTVEEVGSEEGF